MKLTFPVPAEPSTQQFSAFFNAGWDSEAFRAEFASSLAAVFQQQLRLEKCIRDIDIREAAVRAVELIAEISQTHPQFKLKEQPEKFVRCCYRKMWRDVLIEWKKLNYLEALQKKSGGQP
jgi:hypothetical protein